MKRVLIIGGGGIGQRHIRGFLKTDRAEVSVCEVDPAKLEHLVATYEIDQAYAQLDDAQLSDFDMAVIAAPAHVHISLGRCLADAGVPFLMEKPLAVTMDGVDELVECAQFRDLVVRVGYIRRSRPWVQKLRDDLGSGRIGNVRMCYMNVSQEFPKYRPDYQKTYYAKEAMGGGAILDCASHFVDLALFTMGAVKEVGAMYDRLVLEGVECEDSFLLNLRMASGAMVNMTVNQFQKPNVCTAEFIGAKANLKLVDTKALLEFADDDSGKVQTESFLDTSMSPMEIHEALFAQQANDFMDALEGKPDVMCTLEEARDNLRICLAAKDSYRTRRIITL
jgi:predicted dehydrogenase